MNMNDVNNQFLYFRTRVLNHLSTSSDLSKEVSELQYGLQNAGRDSEFESFVQLGGVTLLLNYLSSSSKSDNFLRLTISLFFMIILKIDHEFQHSHKILLPESSAEVVALKEITTQAKYNITYILLTILLQTHDNSVHEMIFTILSFLVKLSPDVVLLQVIRMPSSHNFSSSEDRQIISAALSTRRKSGEFEILFQSHRGYQMSPVFHNKLENPFSFTDSTSNLPHITNVNSQNLFDLSLGHIENKHGHVEYKHSKYEHEAICLAYFLSISKLHPDRLNVMMKCAEIMETIINLHPSSHMCIFVATTPIISLNAITRYFSFEDNDGLGHTYNFSTYSGSERGEGRGIRTLKSYLDQQHMLLITEKKQEDLRRHKQESKDKDKDQQMIALALKLQKELSMKAGKNVKENQSSKTSKWSGIIFLLQSINNLCNHITLLRNENNIQVTSSPEQKDHDQDNDQQYPGIRYVKQELQRSLHRNALYTPSQKTKLSININNDSHVEIANHIQTCNQLLILISSFIIKSKVIAEMASMTNVQLASEHDIASSSIPKKAKSVSIIFLFNQASMICTMQDNVSFQVNKAEAILQACIDKQRAKAIHQVTKRLSINNPIPSYAKPTTSHAIQRNEKTSKRMQNAYKNEINMPLIHSKSGNLSSNINRSSNHNQISAEPLFARRVSTGTRQTSTTISTHDSISDDEESTSSTSSNSPTSSPRITTTTTTTTTTTNTDTNATSFHTPAAFRQTHIPTTQSNIPSILPPVSHASSLTSISGIPVIPSDSTSNNNNNKNNNSENDLNKIMREQKSIQNNRHQSPTYNRDPSGLQRLKLSDFDVKLNKNVEKDRASAIMSKAEKSQYQLIMDAYKSSSGIAKRPYSVGSSARNQNQKMWTENGSRPSRNNQSINDFSNYDKDGGIKLTEWVVPGVNSPEFVHVGNINKKNTSMILSSAEVNYPKKNDNLDIGKSMKFYERDKSDIDELPPKDKRNLIKVEQYRRVYEHIPEYVRSLKKPSSSSSGINKHNKNQKSIKNSLQKGESAKMETSRSEPI